MIEITVTPVRPITAEQLQDMCVALGLIQTMKGRLKTIAANTHWHYKKGSEKGVLEITLHHSTAVIVLSVHENRQADWILPVMKELEKRIESNNF